MTLANYKYIVVEGPIGVGKSSLTRKLADALRAKTLLELPEENPFLERFYCDPARHALQTQLSFLLQRMHQLRGLQQADLLNTTVVSDFLLEKDPLFARLTLDDDEFKLYEQLYSHLNPQAPVPDLVVCLQAPVATLMQRIRKRGITSEAMIAESYLGKLSDSYSRFFYHYDAAPLLIVDTEHFNPVERDEDFTMLLKRIADMRGRREFFNLGE